MPTLTVSISLWLKALLYGVLVLLAILKQCFTKGFGKVLHWTVWDRPACLDDPSLGIHGFLKLKDVRIHYVASGPEDKPLMLFVHGFPEFWYSWRHQIREFQKDYRVVAIDMRGYSESSKPKGKENYTLPKLMSDLELVIQGLGYKSCVLVAHDWGGIIAFAFASIYSSMVDKLIVMNTCSLPLFDEVRARCSAQVKRSWYMIFFQLPYLPEFNYKLMDYAVVDHLMGSKNKKDGSNDDVDPYKYTFSQPGALSAPIDYYRALFRCDISKEIRTHSMDYKMPALLIWACNDKYLGLEIPDSIERDCPSIDVKRIPNKEHFVQTEAPVEVNTIMRDWLAGKKS